LDFDLMDNIIVQSIFAVIAPVRTGGKYFYRLFYRNSFHPAGDLASSLSEEVTP